MSSLEHLQNGRYAILKKLGEGGKGIVYKAKDTALNRVVAIKMLKNPVTAGEAYTRFMTEAQSVAKLNHPNIVSIYDIGKEDRKQFFVLEFVEGRDLRDLIETSLEGKCDIQTVLRIGIDVCSALQYAHSQGILHRDIKPENIKITAEGVAKLMDFGLAKMLGQPHQTQDGVIVGTVAYVAPEIALGRGADARSDLYSFGTVLYETATGKPPFPGEDPVKIIFSHVHDCATSPDKLNSKVPRTLAECIMKLLEKDPGRRYQTAADLLATLRDIAQESFAEVRVPAQKPSAIAAPGLRLSGVGEVRLIDRVEEMALLREAVDRAVRCEGGLVFLYGEPGIGKTRLAREIGAYARLRGMQVLSGRSPALFRMDGAPPYILWNEVIKDYLEMCTPQQLYKAIGLYPSEVCKLVPQIKEKLGAVPLSPPLSPEDERDRLFEAVSQFVTNISKESPLLVVLDDLQWTDQSSLLLLHYLARGVQKEPMLLLGTYRHTDIDDKHALSPVLTELNRERLLQPVRLKRMSLNDTSEMIKQILGQDDVPKEFCELLYEKTGGNPFFIEETIKSLQEEEVIYREGNKWKIKDTSRIEFPETVKRVIKTRISRLDEPSQHILTMASFLGKDFTFEALQGAMGFEEDKLLESIERILKTGLIKERIVRGEESYSFADAVVRDVLHEEVSLLRHKKLHGVVGYALEKAYTDRIDEHLGELAYHFLEGGYKDKALEYFLKAVEKAEHVYAHEQASSYLQHAIEILEGKEGSLEERARVIEKLGNLKRYMGEYDSCLEYWSKSLTLWNQLRDESNIARLHTKLARGFWSYLGDFDKGSEHHRMALDLLEKKPESVELASLYEDISWMLWTRGKSAESLRYALKAFELAKKLRAHEVLADCCYDLATLSRMSAECEEATEYYEQGLKIAIENNLMLIARRIYNGLCVYHRTRGEFQKRSEICQKALETARKVGDLFSIGWTECHLAWAYIEMGELQEALVFCEEGLAIAKKTKRNDLISFAMSVFGLYYLFRGEFDTASQCLKEGYDLARKIESYQFLGMSSWGRGLLLMEREDYAEAEGYFKESSSVFENAGDRDAQHIHVLPYLARVSLIRDEIKEAEELIEKCYRHAERTRNRLGIARAEMLKGILFGHRKDWEQSVQHFEKSLQEHKSLDMDKWSVYYFADLLYEYGLMYLERSDEGDKERAHSLLDRAMAIFEKTGLRQRMERIIAKKKLLTA